MLSNSMRRARPLLLLVLFLVSASACSSVSLPWKNEPVGSEVNLAFVLDGNLLRLRTAEINGYRGRYIFGTATAQTVIDENAAATLGQRADGYKLQIAEKQTVRIYPAIADLGGSADAVIGVDMIGNKAVTIDYRSGLVTYQKLGIFPDQMTLYRFSGPPVISVLVDGQKIDAIVDTTSPDTLTLPGTGARRKVRVSIAGNDFGVIDVGYGDTRVARIGNRLLASFLVSIDYGKGVVGLFRDTRPQG